MILVKVLSIGNSFSYDSHAHLHNLAKTSGLNIETVNLFIGGCSLETHYKNMINSKADYSIDINGISTGNFTSINAALESDTYDVITLQQASHYSGLPQTYIPYLQELASFVRQKQPNAKIYFHQTWSYEIDSTHSGFANYNQNQYEMFRRIIDASQMASKLISAPIIPSGSIIQRIRETVEEFDYSNGGLSLCRDGFHLSEDYGRFAASATWIKTLTGKNVKIDNFEGFDKITLNKILKVVNEFEY